ncbi:hypothetical protein C7S14_6526 [Burkholderia cepacia]|nr:hypothetical protein C7S14_6526 [Burkholderia cepacia]
MHVTSPSSHGRRPAPPRDHVFVVFGHCRNRHRARGARIQERFL